MGKLGYTWYPKDWGNSESVFELTLSERGLYRELIDMAMLNDNKIALNINVWIRKFGSTEDEIEGILITLDNLKLIEIKDDILFIPSCESRLNLVRGGRNGGKKSKPKSKPITKPFESLEDKNDKPIPNQKETETEKEIEIYPSFDDFWNEYDKKVGNKTSLEKKWNKLSQKTKEDIMAYIPNYKLSQPDKKYRKNAETFLNNQSWNDELINKTHNGKSTITNTEEFREIAKAIRSDGVRR